MGTLAQQKAAWCNAEAEGFLGEPQSSMSSGRPSHAGETVDWQQELETGQFTVKQFHEDGFRQVYEESIIWVEEEVVQPNLVQIVP